MTVAATLRSRANAQALGGVPATKTVVFDRGDFKDGVVAGLRVRAYYPVTREFKDVTTALTSLTYQDDEQLAAMSFEMSFDNGDGAVGLFLNRPGMIFFVEAKTATKGFHERQRFVAWDTEVTDLNQGTLTVSGFDHLIYPHSIISSFHYAKDRNHKKGWTADEMAADACQKAKIPVGSLVRCTYCIPYFVLKDASILDMIAKAYFIDSRKTGNHYFIVAEKGLLVVRRARKRTVTFAIDDRFNMRQGSFRRTLSDTFAQSVLPKGGDTSGSTRKKSKTKTSTQSSSEQQAAASADKRLASTALLGALTYDVAHASVRDPDWTQANTQKLADRLGRAAKILELTLDGNVYLRQGDRVFVRMKTSSGAPMRKEAFVSAVTQTHQPGDHSTSVTCRWREKDVANQADLTDVTQKTAASTTRKKGKYTKADLIKLAQEAGFPDPELAARIALAESGGDPNSRNYNKNGSVDRGLWQINSVHKQYDAAKLLDPAYNAKAAFAISNQGQNWTPWVTYNTGAYLQF